MKAVIVDIQKNYAAALAENGEVKKISDNNYSVGDEVSLTEIIPVRRPPRPAAKVIKRVALVAAALVTLTALGLGTAYAVPVGTVSLESEPSIEYTINCFDYVLDVKALNEGGEEVLAEMDKERLKHRNISDAVAVTVEKMDEDGYVTEEKELAVTANTGNDDHSQQLRKDLKSIVENMDTSKNHNTENAENDNRQSNNAPVNQRETPENSNTSQEQSNSKDAQNNTQQNRSSDPLQNDNNGSQPMPNGQNQQPADGKPSGDIN